MWGEKSPTPRDENKLGYAKRDTGPKIGVGDSPGDLIYHRRKKDCLPMLVSKLWWIDGEHANCICDYYGTWRYPFWHGTSCVSSHWSWEVPHRDPGGLARCPFQPGTPFPYGSSVQHLLDLKSGWFSRAVIRFERDIPFWRRTHTSYLLRQRSSRGRVLWEEAYSLW